MKKLFVVMMACLLVLTACSGNGGSGNTSSNEEHAEGLEDVKKMSEDFYWNLPDANPIEMTTYYGENAAAVLTIDGDKFKYDTKDMGIIQYGFIENGVKYFFNEGDYAVQDDTMYDMYKENLKMLYNIYIMGIFEAGDEMEYSATKKTDVGDDKDVELTTTIKGESEGEPVEYIITGLAKENKQFKSIHYDVTIGENKTEMSFTFNYNPDPFEIPEHEVFVPDNENPDVIDNNEYAESPYKTIDDIIAELGEDEELSYYGLEDVMYIIREKDGHYYQLSALFPQSLQEEVNQLDFMEDDYYEKLYEMIGSVEIAECVDFTKNVLSQEERDANIGKTVGDLVNEGYECIGWALSEEGGTVYVEKGGFDYKLEIELDEFDENHEYSDEDLLDKTITGIAFSDVEMSVLPLRVNN